MLRNALLALLITSAFAQGAVLAEECSTSTSDGCIETAPIGPSDVMKRQTAQLPRRPKLGLALGGGGARGAAEVGVMEVFEREGLHFDYIAGTSIGAIVGGLYCAGVPLSKLREEFESGRAMRHFITVPLAVSLMIEPIMLGTRLFGYKGYDGLYHGTIFKNYMNKLTPKDKRDISTLSTPYAAVALNVLDGKPYMIRGGSLVEAMRASSAVPGLRKPIAIGDKLFVDGGVACNVPVKQCREMGADIVLAVNIDEPFKTMEEKAFRKPGSISKRMLSWSLYSGDRAQLELADVVVQPNTCGVSLIATSRQAARHGLAAGRKAAEEAMPAIREKLRMSSRLADKEPTTSESVKGEKVY